MVCRTSVGLAGTHVIVLHRLDCPAKLAGWWKGERRGREVGVDVFTRSWSRVVVVDERGRKYKMCSLQGMAHTSLCVDASLHFSIWPGGWTWKNWAAWGVEWTLGQGRGDSGTVEAAASMLLAHPGQAERCLLRGEPGPDRR